MKIPKVSETEVYANEDGQLVIRQVNVLGDPDDVVVLPRSYALLVAQEIRRLIDEDLISDFPPAQTDAPDRP